MNQLTHASLSAQWFVAMTKPNREELARQHLANQGYEVYLPMCQRTVRWRGRHFTERAPLFPRYLFVRPCREEQSLSSIRSTVGVQQLVRFGMEFAQAQESLVIDIKAMELSLQTDPDPSPFHVGDEVEIMDGPFAGITAKVFACVETRVMLLIELLGSERKLSFSLDQCKSA